MKVATAWVMMNSFKSLNKKFEEMLFSFMEVYGDNHVFDDDKIL